MFNCKNAISLYFQVLPKKEGIRFMVYCNTIGNFLNYYKTLYVYLVNEKFISFVSVTERMKNLNYIIYFSFPYFWHSCNEVLTIKGKKNTKWKNWIGLSFNINRKKTSYTGTKHLYLPRNLHVNIVGSTLSFNQKNQQSLFHWCHISVGKKTFLS